MTMLTNKVAKRTSDQQNVFAQNAKAILAVCVGGWKERKECETLNGSFTAREVNLDKTRGV